jgi:hypothetical protein
MKFFIVCCLSFFCYLPFCYSQLDSNFSRTDKKIMAKIQGLKDEKVGNIVCYYISCNGQIPLISPDSCVAYDIKYLLWQNYSQFFIQRFDECKFYKSISIGSSLFNFIQYNYHKIQKQKLKRGDIVVDHYCVTKIEFYYGDRFLRKHIDWPDLDKHLNKYYLYNKSSKLNRLKNIIEVEVKNYNKKDRAINEVKFH